MTDLGLPADILACLFDLDGVVTKTAVVHAAAWKETFDAFLRERDGDAFRPFGDADYDEYVDGRPAPTASAPSSPPATSGCPRAAPATSPTPAPCTASATARTNCCSRGSAPTVWRPTTAPCAI
ncbi:hypothetical protein SHKM778_52680 [Streptomyces sp. KM77-8]|uniref:Hydrolase n=1 Tax=Streptomyces haneummycinicus TaxID=3074435 RepID=A0AAT9HP87_9ACTN